MEALLLLALLQDAAPVAEDHGVLLRAGICRSLSDGACPAAFGFAPTQIKVWVYVEQDAGVDKFSYRVECDGLTIGETGVDYREDPAPVYFNRFRIYEEDAGRCVAKVRISYVDGSERLLTSREMRVERSDQ